MDRSTLCLVAFLAVLAAVVAEEMYTDKFDHIHPDDILPNDELRDQYYNCIMDLGPCVTEDQKYFREVAAEAFVTKCRKCTDHQKKSFEKIVLWYTENRPHEWTALADHLINEAKQKNISPI